MLNNHSSHFRSSSTDAPTWAYAPPDSASPTQYLASLNSFSKSLPPNTELFSMKETGTGGTKQNWKPKYQHMLQTLTDLTGYLTTQTYVLPSSGFSGYGVTGYTTTSTLAIPQQEELRKEIRALKGLVLNRYSSSVIVCCIRPVDPFDVVGVLSPSQRFHPSRTHVNNDVQYVYTVD